MLKTKLVMLGFLIITFLFIQNSHAGSSSTPMVEIPGGKYNSGVLKKEVDVKTFSMDKFEVTNAQFKEFYAKLTIPEGKADHPVADVSYFESEDYCKSVGKRLPTSIEWEKAARGTDGRTYPWGNTFSRGKANTQEAGFGATTPVGKYKGGASPFGVMDMGGNVWEWVNAWSSDKQQYKLVMGGSYFEDRTFATTTSTLKSIPDDIHEYSGFRCAK